MYTRLLFLLGAALPPQIFCQQGPVSVPRPFKDSSPVPNNMQAFSIKLSYFPDYAGNKTHPNIYSKNLLENFKYITGASPVVRVGGSTQPATFHPELPAQN